MQNILKSLATALVMGLPFRHAFGFDRVVLAVPGPGYLVCLPVQRVQAIGADHAEGIGLQLRYFPAGLLLMHDLRDKNSDFAVVGLLENQRKREQ